MASRLAGRDGARLGVPGALEAAHARGAHGHHAAAALARLGDGRHRALGHGVELGVDDVLLGIVLVHDAEGVQAHLQLHGLPANALLAQVLDELGREVRPAVGAAAELSRREYTVW